MGGRKGGGRISKRLPKKPKIQKNISTNSSVQASSSARDTNTEATSGEEDRKRKVPTNNRFTVNDIPLSEYDTETTTSASVDGASVRLMPPPRPRTQQALQKKTAPIIVANSSIGVVREIASRCSPTQGYIIRSLSVGIRIDMSDLIEHTALKSALQTAGLNFYAYHSSNTRQLKFCLLGLSTMDVDELKRVLSLCGITPADVKPLNIKKQRYSDQAVYLLYFAPGTMKLSELRKVRAIDHIAVRWERYQPSKTSSPAQCRTCQGFGHSSINCYMPPKCMVCAGSHKSDSCPKRIARHELQKLQKADATKIDKSYVKCANCSGNHTSSYAGCEKRKVFLEARTRIENHRRKPLMRIKRPNPLDDQDFPLLGATKGSMNMNALLSEPRNQQQPSYADVIQGIRQEQSSAATVMQALQVMVESMQTMMNRMTTLIEALTLQLSATGIK